MQPLPEKRTYTITLNRSQLSNTTSFPSLNWYNVDWDNVFHGMNYLYKKCSVKIKYVSETINYAYYNISWNQFVSRITCSLACPTHSADLPNITLALGSITRVMSYDNGGGMTTYVSYGTNAQEQQVDGVEVVMPRGQTTRLFFKLYDIYGNEIIDAKFQRYNIILQMTLSEPIEQPKPIEIPDISLLPF